MRLNDCCAHHVLTKYKHDAQVPIAVDTRNISQHVAESRSKQKVLCGSHVPRLTGGRVHTAESSSPTPVAHFTNSLILWCRNHNGENGDGENPGSCVVS
jgi:hypothetical protein